MKNRKLRLENKVALITGASRGIGKAMAIKFAKEGAAVAVNYVSDSDAADKVCREIIDFGGRAIALKANVADAEAIRRMVKIVEDEFHNIDILVNNAGILKTIGLMDRPLDILDELYEVNVKGYINTVQAVFENMKNRKYGKILNISSIAGLGTSLTGSMGYSESKAAVNSLTKRMALELGPYGITVNAIAPGFTKTDMTMKFDNSEDELRLVKFMEDTSMLNRTGEPDDIAAPALFLVSDEASFITGQILAVDGGRKHFISHSS